MLLKNIILLAILILFIFAVIYTYYYSTNCTVSDWSACDGTKQTRIVTQATDGDTACTAEQNVTEKKCTNCTVSDWSACDGTKRTRTVTQATNGGTACTAEQNVTEKKCTDCSVSDWSACDGTKYTRTVTQATNGGTACTAEQNATEHPCLTEPPVKGIAGGNGLRVGDVNGCHEGCLYYGCEGGHHKSYKMGIRYINQPTTTVYNNMTLHITNPVWGCSNMQFYFSNAYTNPPGTEIIIAEANLYQNNWQVARTGIQLVNQLTYRDDGFR